MTGIRLFLRTRFLVTMAVAGVVATLAIRELMQWVLEVRLSGAQPVRFVPMLEALPILYAAFCVLCLRPRYVWEHLGSARYRLHAAAASALVVLLPVLVLLIGSGALPPRTRWLWMITNTVIVASVAIIGGRLFGPLAGALVGLGFFAVCVVIQQLAGPIVPWLPFSSGYDHRPRYVLAPLLVIASVVFHYRRTLPPRSARSFE